MKLSLFGEKYTARTGILALMEDMSAALESGGEMSMLGGGNPASIPEVNRAWRERMEEIMRSGDEFERMVANYDTQKGRTSFLAPIVATRSRCLAMLSIETPFPM